MLPTTISQQIFESSWQRNYVIMDMRDLVENSRILEGIHRTKNTGLLVSFH